MAKLNVGMQDCPEAKKNKSLRHTHQGSSVQLLPLLNVSRVFSQLRTNISFCAIKILISLAQRIPIAKRKAVFAKKKELKFI